MKVVLVLFRPEVLRRDPRVPHLVVALGVETDGERRRGRTGFLAQDPGEGRAVGAAAEKAACLAIGCLATHATAQQLAELALQICQVG